METQEEIIKSYLKVFNKDLEINKRYRFSIEFIPKENDKVELGVASCLIEPMFEFDASKYIKPYEIPKQK